MDSDQARREVLQRLDYYEEAIRRELGENVIAALENWEPLPVQGKAPKRQLHKMLLPSAGARVLAPGQKRKPEELQALVEDLHRYIDANPGLRIELIGKGMGIPTKDLALPIKKLIAEGLIKTKGQKRATTYTATVGRGRK